MAIDEAAASIRQAVRKLRCATRSAFPCDNSALRARCRRSGRDSRTNGIVVELRKPCRYSLRKRDDCGCLSRSSCSVIPAVSSTTWELRVASARTENRVPSASNFPVSSALAELEQTTSDRPGTRYAATLNILSRAALICSIPPRLRPRSKFVDENSILVFLSDSACRISSIRVKGLPPTTSSRWNQ